MVTSKQANSAPAKCTTAGMLNGPRSKSPAESKIDQLAG
jgi:hypothetical protein